MVEIRTAHIEDFKFLSKIFSLNVPKRKRKLLLNRQELKKIEKDDRDIGITVVATSLFISKKGIAKLNISVAKGKREFDKRNVIKDRENKISLKRIKKNFNN